MDYSEICYQMYSLQWGSSGHQVELEKKMKEVHHSNRQGMTPKIRQRQKYVLPMKS